MYLSNHDAYRYLRTGLNLGYRRDVLTDPNDMIDYVSENLARIVSQELAQIVKRRVAKIEAKRGPLSRRERKALARQVLVRRVASVTKKIHREVS